MLRHHATVRGSGHGRQHGGETGIAPEYFEHHEALVGPGASPQAVGHGNGACHAGAEADTVVGAGNIVVHRLGNGYHLHAFLIKAYAVAQRVIPANRDEVVDAKPIQILENFCGQIVALVVVSGLQVSGDAGFLHLAGIGARGMQERTAGAARAIDQVFRQCLKIFTVVIVLFADSIDQPSPSPADTDDFAALAQSRP